MKNSVVKSRRRFALQAFCVVAAIPFLGLPLKRRSSIRLSLHEAAYYHFTARDKESRT